MCHDKQCLHFFHSKCLSQRTLQVTTNLKLLMECAMQEGQILEAVSHDAQLICSLIQRSLAITNIFSIVTAQEIIWTVNSPNSMQMLPSKYNNLPTPYSPVNTFLSSPLNTTIQFAPIRTLCSPFQIQITHLVTADIHHHPFLTLPRGMISIPPYHHGVSPAASIYSQNYRPSPIEPF